MSMSSKLPQVDDQQRSEREKDAIKARDKAEKVASDLRAGKLPSTQQVTSTIETVQKSEIIQSTKQNISPLGQKVLTDIENLLETTKKIFEEKNVGDELQNAIYFTGKATKDASGSIKVPDHLKNQATYQAQTSQLVVHDSLKKILLIPQLFMSSSEFRKLINDLHSILQDALLQVVPGKEQDENAPTSEEQDENAPTRVGTDEEKTLKQARDETAQQVREGTYPIAKEAAGITEGYVKDFSEGNKGFRDSATSGVKHLATHFKEKVSGYTITDEQRNRLVTRFKNAMIETQSRPEYQEVLEDIINIIAGLNEQSKTIAGQFKENVKSQADDATDQSDLETARKNAKKLIENFANGKSLDPLINSIKDLGKNMKEDEELRSYFSDLRNFVVSSIRDSKFVQETDYIEHGSKLIDSGRSLLFERYSENTQHIADEAKAFNEALQEDRLTSQWTHDFETLIQDLFLDEEGTPTVKFELVKDFSKILPVVGESLKYIALPRIENSDEEYDYIFDNIVLCLTDVLPGHMRMNFTTDINLDTDEKNVVQNTAYFEISKVNADARNVAFYYKKKKGLINMMDLGLVDFAVPKRGLTIKLKILMTPPDDSNSTLDIRVLQVDTIIDDLKLKLHDTKHDFMYTLLTPLVEKRLKRQFANLISEKITKVVDYVKDNIIEVEAQVRGQVKDVARKRGRDLREKAEQKLAGRQNPNYNTAQVREE